MNIHEKTMYLGKNSKPFYSVNLADLNEENKE